MEVEAVSCLCFLLLCSQQPHSTRRPLGKKAHDGGEKAEWKTHLGNLKLDNPRWEMTTGH